MKNDVLKGSVLLALGASCYGMLGTFVKMAYREKFNLAEITLSQFILGFTGLFILTLFRRQKPTSEATLPNVKNIFKLIIAGSSLGLTSIFYYQAMQYVPVSVGIVLLMQTVWMGVIVEMIMQKKMPTFRKVASAFIILIGTVLATNLFQEATIINWVGIGWGIMAALCYTATMYSSNNVAIQFPPLKRSLFMILGGLIVVAFVFRSSIDDNFSYQIFFGWGFVLSLFGTILPPLLFSKGMPLTGIGLGAIIASIEIPVSVFMAKVLLHEPISFFQWTGVLLILFAVALMNVGNRKKKSAQAN